MLIIFYACLCCVLFVHIPSDHETFQQKIRGTTCTRHIYKYQILHLLQKGHHSLSYFASKLDCFKNEISNLYYAQVIPFFDILLSEVMKELKGSEPKHSASPGFRKLQKCENYLKIAKINSLKVGNLTCNNWNPFCFRLSSSTVFITALPFSR